MKTAALALLLFGCATPRFADQSSPVGAQPPFNGRIVWTEVCCGANATLLPPSPLFGRAGEIIQNQGTVTIWVGANPAVDGGVGIELAGGNYDAGTPGGVLQGSLGAGNALYCACSVPQTADAGCTAIGEFY